uniref:putative plastid division protein n=1 Tax=Micractinium simplicissimum TaxID=2607983 RepID=UPI0023AA3435|nr:putative plastid division protein [Micractinium simplicissimum]WCO87790.1 putative plastid division protein [Micractinium simplicissimum]
MPIEKNIKSPLEDVKSVSGEHKTLMFQIKQWVLNHRLNSRQKLLSKPINLATVVTFLPLALGFSQFLSHKSRSFESPEKSYYFFGQNLPVFIQFKPKINFETFEYISKSNSRVSMKSNQMNLLFGQSNFGVPIKQSSSLGTKKFSGLSCDFYLLTSGNFFDKTFPRITSIRDLDELPAYVQGLNPNLILRTNTQEQVLLNLVSKKKTKLGSFQKSQNVSEFLFLNSKIKNWKLEKNKNYHTRSKKILDISADTPTKLFLAKEVKKTLPQTDGQKLVEYPTKLFTQRLNFYLARNQFNTELQNLFTKKNISCFSNHYLKTSSQEKLIQDVFPDFFSVSRLKFKVTRERFVETILQEVDKINISEDIANSRVMSGYNYPDMTREELNWFYANTNLKRNKLGGFGLEQKTFLPKIEGSIGNSLQYFFNVQNFPEFSIKTKQVSLQDPNSDQTLSTGPGVLLDSLRALDWKTNGKENLRSWFHTYISPLNPLMQPLDNFFGVYNSPQLLQDNKIAAFLSSSNLSQQDLRKPTKSLLQIKSTSLLPHIRSFSAIQESPIRFSPSTLSFHFPLCREESKIKLIKALDVKVSKTKDTTQFVTVPLLQLHQPVSGSSNSFRSQSMLFSGAMKNASEKKILGTETTQEFPNYSSYFTFTGKGNPDYLFSTDSFYTKNYVTKYASGSYTKTASIYSKTRSSTHIKIDNWEPITATWWLIITQLSFAVFSFNVLKSLIDNYGRELLGYLLEFAASLGILDDSLKQEIELLTGQRDKGFRVVLKSRKTFKDIVGIEKLLPEIYEVVWFLRNSARDFALSQTLPRGILLTGPPGTGKTLLVQALAGEAQVPVVVLSGSSLIEPGESGASKLEMVFQEARELAPCIVFIDEIDTLAQKRSGVVQNPMGPDELVESLTSFEKPVTGSVFENLQLARKKQENEKDQETNIQNNSQGEQLSLLTQFLIELDGIQGRDGVIVIGATNRPEVLDPALLRPGRLEKILQVGLPGHEKRVEILQFYGQGLGYQANIPWTYLGDRTAGFTAADLATLMNESTIKAILTKTNHTIETIEHGIDRLTTSESEKYTVLKKQLDGSSAKGSFLTVASKMSILRLAYYQAGKIVLSALLEKHPKSVVASLWPRRPTIRSAQIATNLQNSVFEFARLCEITDRLVGCYAGKAAEMLFVQQFSSSKYAQLSTLGLDDLLFAQKLIYSVLEKWSFYSKKNHTQQIAYLAPNINIREFREITEKLDLYASAVETIQIPPMSKALEAETSSLESKKKSGVTNWNAQMLYSIPWWQQQVSSELEFVEKNFTNWSRLYLSNPEQSERNPEWFPSDEFYHTSSGLKNVKKAFANLQKTKTPRLSSGLKNEFYLNFEKLETNTNSEKDTCQTGEDPSISDVSIQKIPALKKRVPTKILIGSNFKESSLPDKADFPWNEAALLTRDYPAHSLVLQSFNKALAILNQNRELLDRLVVELLYNEILRQPEIETLLEEFHCSKMVLKTESFIEPDFQFTSNKKQNPQKIQILESSWGLKSRKPMPRWIDFAEFSGETT